MRTVKEIRDLIELLDFVTEKPVPGHDEETINEMRMVRDWLAWVLKEEPLYYKDETPESFVNRMIPLVDIFRLLKNESKT